MIKHKRTEFGCAGRFWSSQDGHTGHERMQKYEKKEDIDICLNCTKERCTGTKGCFRKTKMIGVCEDEEGTD